MKKSIYTLTALIAALLALSCSDYETYGDQKKREREAISKFISDSSYVIIGEDQFHNQGDATIGDKQFVLLTKSGVYMQIVDKGVGDQIKDGESLSIICRFIEKSLLDTTILYNNSQNTIFDRDILNVSRTGATYSATFISGVMLDTYGSTVPEGWLVPLQYINLARRQDQLARVRLIVPHSQGTLNNAKSNVRPYFYDITYQRGRSTPNLKTSNLMTLIKSISGIRGTIGGHTGDTLNPLDIVKFTTAYATFIGGKKIVVGRDGRISGPMVRDIVCGTLVGMGYEVVDIGLATTPTTELAVRWHEADGGIIITASHNPTQWNALKLLNSEGEFLTAADGAEVLRIAEAEDFDYAPVERLGRVVTDDTMNQRHVDSVLHLRLADIDAIRKRHFRVCADTINSVGGIILPQLFEALGIDYEILNGQCTGQFAHNPEPLEKNLGGIMDKMRSGGFDLGIVVDPDVDRLAFICEDGTMFGEEYTLVSVADYVLSQLRDESSELSDLTLNTVSNLSSTRALRDVTERHGGHYSAAAVGEVNVTTKMKEVGAVIGGEGNGGVIYPESHYGRDALVGIVLFLSSLAHKGCTVSELRHTFPDYQIAKNRIDLTPDTDVNAILVKVKELFANDPEATVNDIDGVKIDFPTRWVHLRKSNTEPIIRVYSEAPTMEEADELGKRLMQVVYDMQ